MIYKKYSLAISLFLFFLLAFTSVVYAITENMQLYLWPYYQGGPQAPWANIQYDHINETIRQSGCGMTSLSMVSTFSGMGYIPKSGWSQCEIDWTKQTNPLNLNNWLKNNGGYNSTGKVDWLSMKKFYYCGLGNEVDYRKLVDRRATCIEDF